MLKKTKILLGMLSVLVLAGAGCIQFSGSSQGPMGVFASTDGADTWKQKNTLVTNQGIKNVSNAKVFRIFTDPSDAKALYMATRGQGLNYSYDRGETWAASPELANKFIYGLAVHPTDTCTMYVTDGPNVYRTTNCQRTWEIVFTEARPTQRLVALAIDYANPTIVYAAEAGGDVFRSKDSGKSWQLIKSFNLELRHLAVDPFNPKRVYVASYTQGLFRSEDNGDSWQTANGGFESYNGSLTFYRLVFSPTEKNTLFWISRYGIFRSTNGGDTWTEMKLLTPPGSVNIYAFAVNPKNISEMYYTATSLGDSSQSVRSTLYKTTDGGTNWVTKKLPTNTIPIEILINKDNGNNILVGFTTL